jgi:4-hydroxy-3-methylbut-2-en-1-yl diphosphate synthase IspG/GcpE
MEKTLGNTTASQAKENVKDIQFWGNGDTFKLISKASSQNEGWMKSTKAMEIANLGCVVQVTTQQRNPDLSYSVAEAVTFVPHCRVNEVTNEEGKVIERRLEMLPTN